MEIIVDNFAGGGGASTGIELATGRSVDIAINHDPAAIAMHRANHPASKHYCFFAVIHGGCGHGTTISTTEEKTSCKRRFGSVVLGKCRGDSRCSRRSAYTAASTR